MRLLVLAALAAVAVADVSELIGYRYNTPASSYGVPQNSVTERQFNVAPTEPSPSLHLPAFEHQDFRAINPIPGAVISTTPAPFIDGGIVSSTPAPSIDTSSIVSSTPAPSLVGGGYNFNAQLPGFNSGFGFTTPAPSLSFNSGGLDSVGQFGSGFVSSTPAPHVDATSGSQESLNFNAQLPNLGFNSFTTPAPTVFSTTVAPTVSTLAPGFGLGLGNSYNFPSFNSGFGLDGFSTVAPITVGPGGLGSIGTFANDAALNSVSIHGITSGGSINDAFGGAGAISVAPGTLPQPQQVSKHLYFYAAPEDPEPPRTRINVAPVPPPKKNVRIIFIKTPTPPAPAPINIAAPPQDEEKTVVYVLVKKPEDTQNIEIQTPPPTPPAKPEVFFIKYKTQQEAEEAIAQVQGSVGQGVGPSASADVVNEGGLISSFNQNPVTTLPVLNYVSTTTTPAPLLNFGGGISGPIGNFGFGVNPQFDNVDISQNLISSGGQASSLFSTGSPLIGSTDSSFLGSTTIAPPLAPHVTYGPPLFKKRSPRRGWYVLRDWTEVDFDRNKILTQLHARYGVSPFFKISVEPNPDIPGHHIIHLSPSGLGLPDKEYYFRDENDRIQLAYKEYIRDVIIHLSNTARNEATKFGTDMFSYEKRIAEVTPDRISMQNPVTTYNLVSVSELKETTLIPFYDLLQAMYPDSNITENTQVVVTSQEYLGHIAQIISTTDMKTMNGYLVWTLVREYIPYLASKYTSAMDTFNSELYGVEKSAPRWEMCAGLVKKFMGLATNNFLQKENPISEKTIHIVNSTFRLIVSVVKERLSKFENTAMLYQHLKQKLSTLRLQIGVPETVTQDSFLKKYYQGLIILRANMFVSIKHAVSFQRKWEEKKLTNLVHEEPMMSYALSDTPKVVYSPSDHTVIIPRSLLTEPVFHPNYPRSVIYGRLGVEIAEAVISSIMPYDSLWAADRKILSRYHMTVKESVQSIQPVIDCLSKYVLNLNLDIPYSTANETSLRNLKHLSAVSVANEALKLSLEKVDHVHQPSLEMYEDSALFFLAYSQTQCSESSNQHKLYDNIVHFQLPQRTLLYLAWAQVREFSESLECNFNKKLQCSDIF